MCRVSGFNRLVFKQVSIPEFQRAGRSRCSRNATSTGLTATTRKHSPRLRPRHNHVAVILLAELRGQGVNVCLGNSLTLTLARKRLVTVDLCVYQLLFLLAVFLLVGRQRPVRPPRLKRLLLGKKRRHPAVLALFLHPLVFQFLLARGVCLALAAKLA